jgi:hypothetical protein
MSRLLGGGLPESVRRFATRLRGWFPRQDTFTTADARRREGAEGVSRRSVYGWLGELHTAGVVGKVTESRGRTAATWRMTDQDPDEAPILPHPAAVFAATTDTSAPVDEATDSDVF